MTTSTLPRPRAVDLLPGTRVRMTSAGCARMSAASLNPTEGVVIGYVTSNGYATPRRFIRVAGVGTDGKRHVGNYCVDSWERVANGVLG